MYIGEDYKNEITAAYQANVLIEELYGSNARSNTGENGRSYYNQSCEDEGYLSISTDKIHLNKSGFNLMDGIIRRTLR